MITKPIHPQSQPSQICVSGGFEDGFDGIWTSKAVSDKYLDVTNLVECRSQWSTSFLRFPLLEIPPYGAQKRRLAHFPQPIYYVSDGCQGLAAARGQCQLLRCACRGRTHSFRRPASPARETTAGLSGNCLIGVLVLELEKNEGKLHNGYSFEMEAVA